MKKISTIICIAIFICVLGGTLCMTFLSVNLSGKEIRKEAEYRLEALSNQYANAMNSNLILYETIINDISNYIVTTYDSGQLGNTGYNKEYLDHIRQYIYLSTQVDTNILGIYFYLNPDLMQEGYGVWFSEGKEIIEDPGDQYEAYLSGGSGWDFYYDAKANESSMWLNPYYDEDIDKNCTSYINPLYVDGIMCGVIGLDIDITSMEVMVAEVSIYETGYAFLLDSDGYFIADQNYTSKDNVRNAGYKKLAAALEVNKNGIVRENLKEEYYFAYSHLDNGFSFVTAVRSAEVVSGINQVRNYLFAAGAVVILIAVIISYRLGKNISEPIVRTTMDMGMMEQGNFTGSNHRRYDKSHNEIGILARAMGAIQKYMINTVAAIRNSSNNIQSSSQEINTITLELSNQITNISAASQELAAGMEETAAIADNLSSISDKISEYVDDMESNMRDTYQKLHKTSNQYSDDAVSILETLRSLTDNYNGIGNEIKIMVEIFKELKSASADGANGIVEIAASTDEIYNNIQTLQSNVDNLESISRQLVIVVKNFIT